MDISEQIEIGIENLEIENEQLKKSLLALEVSTHNIRKIRQEIEATITFNEDEMVDLSVQLDTIRDREGIGERERIDDLIAEGITEGVM